MSKKIIGYILLILAAALLTACLPVINIGGNVSGLTSKGLVLNYLAFKPICDPSGVCGNEGFDSATLRIDGNGNFAFTNLQVPTGATKYRVSILTQPSGQFCTVSNGEGAAPTANINNIDIQCRMWPVIAMGGSVYGLTGTGLALNLIVIGPVCDSNPSPSCSTGAEVSESISINDNGNFTFKSPVPTDAINYGVSIGNQPSGQFCWVTNGQGAAPAASISNIDIQCRFNPAFNVLAGPYSFLADIAADSAGNAYVTDTNTIHKITSAGVVTPLAGTAGMSGSANGTGAAASFNALYGIAVDSAGYVYVTDPGNHNIRKITPAGVVTTLAGAAGTSGSTDGIGANARFTDPRGIAVDSAGNVYVTDSENATIRKITPAGAVTTLAGTALSLGSVDGTGADARFNNPIGIAVDSLGNVYVVDSGNFTIRKITPAGVVTTLAGVAGSSGNADGTGADARFDSPYSIAIDNTDTIYVADQLATRRISPAGLVTSIAYELSASYKPRRLAVSAGKFFVIKCYFPYSGPGEVMPSPAYYDVLWATIP